METTSSPPWLDPDGETVPTFTPSGRASRIGRAARRPRRVTFLTIAGWCSLLVGIVAAVAVLVAYLALADGWQAALLRDRDHYPGRVVRIDDTSDDDDDGWVKVRYGVDADHQGWAWVRSGDVDRYDVGRSVTALVDRSTGDVTLPGENYTPDWFKRLGICVGLLAMFMVATGIWVIDRRTVARPRRSAVMR